MLNRNFLLKTFSAISLCLFSLSTHSAVGKSAMVVSSQHLATKTGLSVLKAGGNAIDAAVAMGYALTVVHPCCGGIGGGGFMIIRLADGSSHFINFRENAPRKSRTEDFVDKKGHRLYNDPDRRYLAVGVPGAVMGLNYALTHYGKLPLKQVIQPAIQLAQDGYHLSAADIIYLHQDLYNFRKDPVASKLFLKAGKPYQVGDLFKQPQLAKDLRLIQQQGNRAFYSGEITTAIIKAAKKNNGLLRKADFKHYHVKESTPLICKYRGYKIIGAPPPSSGTVTLCQILKILEKDRPTSRYHPKTIHRHVEAMRYAFADRNRLLGDPEFVKNPIQQMLSPKHVSDIRKKIIPNRAGDSENLRSLPQPEGYNTTHYSIVDSDGNAVSVTLSLNNFFGVKVIAKNTGFFLNDQMRDFSFLPGRANVYGLLESNPNHYAPGKQPLSSMSPTIITKHNKLFMVLGASGGPTIITTVLGILTGVVDYHMDLQKAVNSPRIHMQWFPDTVYVEPVALTPSASEQLKQMGYNLQRGSPYYKEQWGAANCILLNSRRKLLIGAADKRRPAALAQGY